MPLPLLLIPALIAAASAAAGGIAGAAGQKANSDAAADQAAQDRALQEKLQKLQMAQQAGQFQTNLENQGLQTVEQAKQSEANSLLDRASERQKSRAGLLNALSKLV